MLDGMASIMVAVDPNVLTEWVDSILDVSDLLGGQDHRDSLIVLRDAMTRLEAERDRLREAQKRAVKTAADAGISDAEIARLVGVSRLTVRAWLGKSV